MDYNEILAEARSCIGPFCKACPVCDGSGVRDCNCPGLCHVHEAHTIPAAPARPWLIPDPWSKPTAPEPAY